MPRQRAQLEGVLAVGRARKASDRDVGPFVRNVVAPFEGREGHRRDPPVRVACQVDDVGDEDVLGRECLDRRLEPWIGLERLGRHPLPLAGLLERPGVRVRKLDGASVLVRVPVEPAHRIAGVPLTM